MRARAKNQACQPPARAGLTSDVREAKTNARAIDRRALSSEKSVMTRSTNSALFVFVCFVV